MKKRVISWLLTVVMVVSLLPTSVLADTPAAEQEQQTQQEQTAPADTENTVPAEDEETQEQQEPAPETPAFQSARSGKAASMAGLPDDFFADIANYAEVTYGHNEKFTGTSGEEFVYDADKGALKSNSGSMNESFVWMEIRIKDNVSPVLLSFDYKVSSEKNYDGLKINGGNLISGVVGWTSYTITANSGDTIQLTYEKDRSSNGNDDCVWLKNFRAEAAYTITLQTTPSGATIVLKDADGKVMVGADGVYVVTPGTYTYTAALFGYVTGEGSIEVTNENIRKDIALTQQDSHEVVFEITDPEGLAPEYTVQIKHDGEVVRTLTGRGDALKCALPTGEYTYTLTGESCAAISEMNFSVTDRTTVSATMVKEVHFEDFFKGLDISAENSRGGYYDPEKFVPVQEETAAYLESTKGSGTSQMTITATADTMLSFQYLSKGYKSTSAWGTSYAFSITQDYVDKLKAYANEDWQTFSIFLAKDKTLTLKFSGDSSGQYYVRLKDFRTAAPQKLTFAVTGAEGYTIQVTKDGSEVPAGTDGSYTVSAGTYAYTITKFGYVTKTGTVSVAGSDVNIPVTLTEAARYSVTFQITKPDDAVGDATITVKLGDQTVYTGTAAGCNLPNGTYTYTVTHPKCEEVSTSFTVAGADIEQPVSLKRKLVFSDFFDTASGITAVPSNIDNFKGIKDDSGDYLKTDGITGGESASIIITATENVRLSFEYLAATYSSGYPFTVKLNNEQKLSAWEKKSWERFAVSMKSGDKLTLTYDHAWADSYYLALKNFATAPLYTIRLTVPKAAEVVLKDRANAVIAGTAGEFVVPDGTYTYTVSKYGYETKTGTIEVEDRDVSKDVAITALTEYQVTFNVDPEGAAVTLTHPVGGTIQPADGAYTVYAGETYAYTVSKENYIPVAGSFTAAKNDTIAVKLIDAGQAWDGATKTQPKQENGIYLIGTAAELAWFADAVNKGDTTISGKLTANINLSNKTWTAIGTSSNKFAGTLDGDETHHYTVSGLTGSNGLIGNLAASGAVKNLTVHCTISGSGSIGGIAGSSAGTVESCMVYGSISGTVSYGSMAIGGIIGSASAGSRIVGCVNAAAVKNAYAGFASALNTGGIVGYTYGAVENCYSTGSVSALNIKKEGATPNYAVGGLAGQVYSSAAITECYTIGTVTGPETGIGAFAGKIVDGANISNCRYLEDLAPKAVAAGAATGISAVTANKLKTDDDLIYLLGLYKDTDNINGGFPVLPWQGGTRPTTSTDKQAVLEAQRTLVLRGMTAADKAKQVEADWYAVNIWELYQPMEEEDVSQEEMLAELRANFDIDEPEEGTTDLKAYYTGKLREQFYKEQGLDPVDPEILTPDASDTYQIKDIKAVTVTLDDEGEKKVCTTSLVLPSTVQVMVNGEKQTVDIAWTSSSALVNTDTGALEAPESGKRDVTLTAAISKNGTPAAVKTFTLCLWSQAAEDLEFLEGMKAVLEKRSTVVQPLQIYGNKNITEAVPYTLVDAGYSEDIIPIAIPDSITEDGQKREPHQEAEINADALTVELLDNGSINGTGTKAYIAEDGTVTYFTGEKNDQGSVMFSVNAVQYTGLKFKLTYRGQSVTAEDVRACVGWDTEYVYEHYLLPAAQSLTWDTIKDTNENTAVWQKALDGTGGSDSLTDGGARWQVEGEISKNLKLPCSLQNSAITVQWSSQESDSLVISDNNDGTYTADLVRPLKGQPAVPIRLKATLTFNHLDDYTTKHNTGDTGMLLDAYQMFAMSIAPNDRDISAEIQTALEKYPSLIRDFVNKDEEVDLNNVAADLQMPRPGTLQEAGIMDDSWYRKVLMVSNTPDVLAFNGYHAMVYRPLPGEEPATAKYTIIIKDRKSGAVLGQQEFSLTVQPFKESDLTAAEEFMRLALKPDTYWNGIKNENTDKANVTSDLYPFAEICKNEDGTLKYVRGTVNMSFDGIQADDIPGWLDTEKYRCFRSSRPSVVEHELLRVHRPTYNTEVTVDSVLTYTKFAQYWEKFGLSSSATDATRERYARFEQFYKQPVSAAFTVTGTTGEEDPNKDSEISVLVNVQGIDGSGFKDIGSYTFKAPAAEDWTAWDALRTCLTNKRYTYTGTGTYVSSITDDHGNTLAEKDARYGEESGWMFRITRGEETKTPASTLVQTYLCDKDVITVFYTKESVPLDPSDPVDPSTAIPAFGSAYEETKKFVAADTARYAPQVGTSGETDGVSGVWGDWIVLAMARSDMKLSDQFIKAYYAKVEAYVKANYNENGTLKDPTRPSQANYYSLSDNARLVLALTAIGKDPAAVGGKNLLTALQTKAIWGEKAIYQKVFALLALNSNEYGGTEGLVEAILAAQEYDGNWKASVNDTLPDMTAMALTALAPYYGDGNSTLDAAVNKAIGWLSEQYQGGKYTNSETCAQVVVALSALKIDANADARFVRAVAAGDSEVSTQSLEQDAKTVSVSVLGSLLRYHLGEGNGFAHEAKAGINRLATEQALYAMAAYQRYATHRRSLYDMRDAKQAGGDDPKPSGGSGNYYYSGTTAGTKTDSANTADDSQMVLWLGSAALAAAAVVVLTHKRKRVSK